MIVVGDFLLVWRVIEYMNNVDNMEIDKISSIANHLYNNIAETGIQAIRDFFSKGKTLPEEIKYDVNKEYLKQMILSQLNISHMLFIHKYFLADFDRRPDFNKEANELRQGVTLGSTLSFDNDTLDALFGNTLEIATPEEYENWREFAYQAKHNEKKFDEIYFEEEAKWMYENEKNPIKKFIQLFKYKRMQKGMLLEDYYVKRVREMIRNGIKSNPEDTFSAYRECHTMLAKGVTEYEELKTVEDIIKMTLISLQYNQDEPIDIEKVCSMIRSSTQMGVEYRNKPVTLGTESGIRNGPVIHTIDFSEVPEAIEELQERYEETYNKEQGKEDYIRDISKIYADFIYIQPYEDGNKRTSLCLLNSMLLSKGIVPPPISLINNERMTEAFYKVQDNDYTMLQDIIVDEYRKMQSDNLDNSEFQGNKEIDIQNEK